MVANGKKNARTRKSESGAALIEFSLVLIPSLGCIFLLIALAWVIFAWACVQEGVREGTRVAVTCTPATGLNAAIKQVVQQYSFGFINASNIGTVVSVQYLDPSSLAPISGQIYTGDVVKVTVSNLPVDTFVPILQAGANGTGQQLRAAGPLHVSASAADIMSCPTPATP